MPDRKALTALGESVGLYRELVKAEPARDTLGLAASLTNLGVSLAKLGEHWKALTAFEEAVRLRRELAKAEPARHTPGLDVSLSNLSVSLLEVGRHDDGLQAKAEAVAWWCRLSQLRPDEYNDAYARERARLAQLYAELGHAPFDAIRAEQDAARKLGFGPT